jgi:hypothetical protein
VRRVCLQSLHSTVVELYTLSTVNKTFITYPLHLLPRSGDPEHAAVAVALVN